MESPVFPSPPLCVLPLLPFAWPHILLNGASIHGQFMEKDGKRWENPLEMEIYMGQSSINGGKFQQTIFAIFAHRRLLQCAPLFKRDMMCTPAILEVSPWHRGVTPSIFRVIWIIGLCSDACVKIREYDCSFCVRKKTSIESIVHSFNCQVELPHERRNRSVIYIRPPPLPFVALLLLSNAPNNSQTSSRRPQFHRKHIPSETSI